MGLAMDIAEDLSWAESGDYNGPSNRPENGNGPKLIIVGLISVICIVLGLVLGHWPWSTQWALLWVEQLPSLGLLLGLIVGWIMKDLVPGLARRLILGLGHGPGSGSVHGPSDGTYSGPCMGLYFPRICDTSWAL